MARGVAVGVIAIVAGSTFSPPTQSANAHRRRYGLAALAYFKPALAQGLHAVAAQRFAKMCDRALSKIL